MSNFKPQVFTSEIQDYVKGVLEYKQNIQAIPSENSKYQAKTPFIRVSSNAVYTANDVSKLLEIYNDQKNKAIKLVLDIIVAENTVGVEVGDDFANTILNPKTADNVLILTKSNIPNYLPKIRVKTNFDFAYLNKTAAARVNLKASPLGNEIFSYNKSEYNDLKLSIQYYHNKYYGEDLNTINLKSSTDYAVSLDKKKLHELYSIYETRNTLPWYKEIALMVVYDKTDSQFNKTQNISQQLKISPFSLVAESTDTKIDNPPDRNPEISIREILINPTGNVALDNYLKDDVSKTSDILAIPILNILADKDITPITILPYNNKYNKELISAEIDFEIEDMSSDVIGSVNTDVFLKVLNKNKFTTFISTNPEVSIKKITKGKTITEYYVFEMNIKTAGQTKILSLYSDAPPVINGGNTKNNKKPKTAKEYTINIENGIDMDCVILIKKSFFADKINSNTPGIDLLFKHKKLTDDTLKNNLKLLNILNHMMINKRKTTDEDIKKVELTDYVASIDANNKEKLYNLFSTLDTKYAESNVLESISTQDGSIYDGGMFMFEKDGNITNLASGSFVNASGTPLTNDQAIEEKKLNIRSGLGIKPKVGIVGLSVDTKGKIGAIRRATLNVKAFTLEQLQMVQSLYMRPGVFLFMEWGWSIHPKWPVISILGIETTDYDKKPKLIPNNYRINLFDEKTDNDTLLKNIETYKKESNGHYDAIFGVVSNFNWSMNDAGEFDITINLVSQGSSMLALEMANNFSGYMDSSFSVNIFNRFRQLFDVLMKNNENYALLAEEVKSSTSFGLPLSKTLQYPFLRFEIKEPKKVGGTATGVAAKVEPAKMKELIDFLNADAKKSTPIYSVDIHIPLGTVKIKDIYHPFNTMKIDQMSYLQVKFGGEYSDLVDGTNYSLGNNPKHIIRFPLINELKKDKPQFDDNILNAYMENQGYYSGGSLHPIIQAFSTINPDLGNWHNLVKSGLKIKDDNSAPEAQPVTIPISFIKQYKTVDPAKRKSTVDTLNAGIISGLSVATMDAAFLKINNVYEAAYDKFRSTLSTYKDANNVTMTKNHNDAFKYLSSIVDPLRGLTGSVFNPDWETKAIEAIIYTLKSSIPQTEHYEILKDLKVAIFDIVRLDYYSRIGGKDGKEYQNKDWKNWSYQEYTGRSYSERNSVSVIEDTLKSPQSEIKQQSTEDIIKARGGNKPYFINLKYLLYLLDLCLINKEKIQIIAFDNNADTKPQVDTLSKNDENVKKLILDIKKQKENSTSFSWVEYKTTDEYYEDISGAIASYNSSADNLKNGLFAGINYGDPVLSRKHAELTSIDPGNVILLTETIINGTESIKNNTYLKGIAVNNTIDGDNGGNLLQTVYISAKYIRDTITSSPTLDSFLKEIFSKVYTASGNFIDIGYTPESDTQSGKEIIKIFDRNLSSEKEVTDTDETAIFKFKVLSNQSIVTNLTFSGKLPTSFQRVAFVASSAIPSNTSGDNIVNEVLDRFSNGFVNNSKKIKYLTPTDDSNFKDAGEEKIIKKNRLTLKNIKEDPFQTNIVQLNENFPPFYSNYLQVEYLKKLKIKNAVIPIKKARFFIPPVGLELSFIIDGTSGLAWSNLISIDYLPNGLRGAQFQITGLTDEIKDGGWETKIQGLLRSISQGVI